MDLDRRIPLDQMPFDEKLDFFFRMQKWEEDNLPRDDNYDAIIQYEKKYQLTSQNFDTILVPDLLKDDRLYTYNIKKFEEELNG